MRKGPTYRLVGRLETHDGRLVANETHVDFDSQELRVELYIPEGRAQVGMTLTLKFPYGHGEGSLHFRLDDPSSPRQGFGLDDDVVVFPAKLFAYLPPDLLT